MYDCAEAISENRKDNPKQINTDRISFNWFVRVTFLIEYWVIS